MATRFHVRVWTRFLASPEEVWRHVVDPAQASAGWEPVLQRGGYPAFGEGADVRLACVGLPVRGVGWAVETTEVVEGVRWVTAVTTPLFSDFTHAREVEATPDGARYLDTYTFTPAGPASKAVAIGVQRLGVRRHQALARALAADPQATGVSVLRVRVEDAWTSD